MTTIKCRQLDECPSSYHCMCDVIETRDAALKALAAMTTCGHVAEVAGDLIPNAVRDRKQVNGWAPCACMALALKVTCGDDKEESSDKGKTK